MAIKIRVKPQSIFLAMQSENMADSYVAYANTYRREVEVKQIQYISTHILEYIYHNSRKHNSNIAVPHTFFNCHIDN